MKFFEKEIQLAAAEKYWLNVFVFVFGSLHIVLNNSNHNLKQTSQIAEKPVAPPAEHPGLGGDSSQNANTDEIQIQIQILGRDANTKIQIRFQTFWRRPPFPITQLQRTDDDGAYPPTYSQNTRW